MSLVLLPNNVWPDAAYLAVTDTSNAATSDTAGAENVAGGQRHLAWSSNSTAARRLVYVNKAGGLTCTHVVLARADLHAGKNLSLLSWSNYSSVSTTEFSTASFAEALVGPRSQDWVYELSASNKQGVGISLNSTDYVKHVYKFFASNGITFDEPTAPAFRVLPFPSRHVHRRQMFLVDVEWRFSVQKMTRAEVEAFESVPDLLSEPVFLYDSAGRHIHHKLIHGVVADYEVRAVFDNIYELTFIVKELRSWL